MDEERNMHTTSIEDLENAYKQQAKILQERMAREREEGLRSQHIYEETLRAKYEMMVEGLQDRVRTEQEAQMRRALDNLEKTARAKADTARLEQEIQSNAEMKASEKFQQLVADLRATWEEEEKARSKQLEDRLRFYEF